VKSYKISFSVDEKIWKFYEVNGAIKVNEKSNFLSFDIKLPESKMITTIKHREANKLNRVCKHL